MLNVHPTGRQGDKSEREQPPGKEANHPDPRDQDSHRLLNLIRGDGWSIGSDIAFPHSSIGATRFLVDQCAS